MDKQFRFGVGLHTVRSAAVLAETARRLEGSGYDVLHVPDHLGAPAPFPALVAAAAATTTIRLGTYVLNACFYKPALLTRDIADTDLLSGGRLEIGLGAGYVRAEFEAAEVPFPSAGRRIEYLEHLTTYVATHQPRVPILIAGSGDRLLTVAARHAGIIGMTGARVAGAADALAERISFVRAAAGDRFDDLELNLAITAVPTDASGLPDLSLTRRFAPTLSDQELLAMPAVLSGSPHEMADTLREYRRRYGLSYFTVQQNHAEAFAKVIAALR
ncbi:TIGR03621 family F420-dependent LLM class oxidoreductase [Mycolicibacter sinensis]|uniref:F420-dependent oxidoreductase n=1 Tax=Mycolicibacter sinensis (strain JDM601) TaxID=875328 RepID=A0A1A2EAV0_MYCSD|nr:TIGR03621 family F420-dependent LLM class oxidoreductase [Mycolicibacter sinensis]OBG01230.1 F420-dependent oxidoreductase [Mycolicibacter sinensis]OBG03534.1 F420-dependent oxidoreductase [Mycolicibacter sinensis]